MVDLSKIYIKDIPLDLFLQLDEEILNSEIFQNHFKAYDYMVEALGIKNNYTIYGEYTEKFVDENVLRAKVLSNTLMSKYKGTHVENTDSTVNSLREYLMEAEAILSLIVKVEENNIVKNYDMSVRTPNNLKLVLSKKKNSKTEKFINSYNSIIRDFYEDPGAASIDLLESLQNNIEGNKKLYTLLNYDENITVAHEFQSDFNQAFVNYFYENYAEQGKVVNKQNNKVKIYEKHDDFENNYKWFIVASILGLYYDGYDIYKDGSVDGLKKISGYELTLDNFKDTLFYKNIIETYKPVRKEQPSTDYGYITKITPYNLEDILHLDPSLGGPFIFNEWDVIENG